MLTFGTLIKKERNTSVITVKTKRSNSINIVLGNVLELVMQQQANVEAKCTIQMHRLRFNYKNVTVDHHLGELTTSIS